MADALRHPGAILGVARFYHDPRGSMRGMLDSGPGEARLMAYAMGAALVLLSGRLLGLAASLDWLEPDLPGRVAAQVAAVLFFLPLAYYALAAIGTLIARAFRGAGGWYEGRAAFFWAALVSSPVVVLSGLAPLAMQGAPRGLVVLASQVGPVFFAWALALCYAEAFGFARAWAVFAVIAALVLLIVGAPWWLSF